MLNQVGKTKLTGERTAEIVLYLFRGVHWHWVESEIKEKICNFKNFFHITQKSFYLVPNNAEQWSNCFFLMKLFNPLFFYDS